MLDQKNQSFFHIISFSMFSDVKGPVPVYCYPESISSETQVEIAMKSVSLLMGEAVYQAGLSDDLRYFGILPFPDLSFIGLTYFFLIPDKQARGKSKAATVTIVVKETNHHFIYDNIHTLRILLEKTRVNLRQQKEFSQIKSILNTLRTDIMHLYENPEDSKMQSRMKIVFAGLDNSGKTSFLKMVQQEYSKIMGILPTKGIARSERELLSGITALEWDFGGQKSFRENYFKNATIYLNDVDLLFYFIDIQELTRLQESLHYLSEILHTLENFGNFPLIQIALHKYDLDLLKSQNLDEKFNKVKRTLLNLYPKWNLKIFPTSLFNPNSINKCFSYGFSRLSPNTDKFNKHLKKFLERMNGHSVVLLTNNALVLGEYSLNTQWNEFIDDIRIDMYEIFKMERNIDTKLKKFHIMKMDGVTIILYRFMVDSKQLLVLFDTDQSIPKIEKSIKKLKKHLSPLIQSYLG